MRYGKKMVGMLITVFGFHFVASLIGGSEMGLSVGSTIALGTFIILTEDC